MNVIDSKEEIRKIKEEIEKFKKDSAALPDNHHYANLFEKLYKVIKILLFLTVGQKKIDKSKAQLVNHNNEVNVCRLKISELTGKINLLQIIKEKLKKELPKQPNVAVVAEKNENPSAQIITEVFYFKLVS